MTKNKDHRKQLQGHYRALEEHLEKLENEQRKSLEGQDSGLIIHWEKTVADCRYHIIKLERRLNR